MEPLRRIKSDEARRKLRDLLDDVERGQPVIIQRYDRDTAVLISIESFRQLQEGLEGTQ